MIVTINTDASFHMITGSGGYAFWIVCNEGRIQKYAPLKEQCKNPDDCELKCILNAMHMTSTQGWDITTIIINTDSLNSIHIFGNDKEMIRRWNLGWGGLYRGMFNNYKYKMKNPNIIFKHIRSHQEIISARSFVNDWCDKKAKEGMWLKIKQQDIVDLKNLNFNIV